VGIADKEKRWALQLSKRRRRRNYRVVV